MTAPPARPRNAPHVIVLGGGACGMSAAMELLRLGLRATVIEREPRVGGLCGTHERDGWRFDLGGHRFITQSRDIDALVRGLLEGDLLERRRSSVILNGGRRFKYPLELDDVVRNFGLVRGARALASYGVERLRSRLAPLRDRSFRDWVTHRFGGELYGAFFGPYTGKLWGLAPEDISADWAAERISLPSLADVALRLLHVPRPGVRTYARRYLYPRLGIGQIFERSAQVIAARGGSVRTGDEVIGLCASAGQVRSVRVRGARGEEELACDAVISTISLPVLARMTGPLPASVERSARRLRFRAIRLLNLQLDGPPVSPHTWMYVSEPGYVMSRIQEPLHRSPHMAPAGTTSLMLEIPCDAGDALWSCSDGELYERCLRDLERLGIHGLRTRTRGFFSTFVREGYPIYHLDYVADRDAVLAHVARTQGLVSCGRQGAFRYMFMDSAMQMGLDAARSLAAGRQLAPLPAHATRALYEGTVLTA
ncbi:MAG: FAD-dependent oxidoreductase [Deltaproteobacteria bacterium]|nr:FAD-dependent oxidoreductase [Deltaproteobacteria bacterium]